MTVALSPFGGVSSWWACELNVLHLQTVGGLLVSMEHPHAAGCQYGIARPDLLRANVVRVGDESVAPSLMREYALVPREHSTTRAGS